MVVREALATPMVPRNPHAIAAAILALSIGAGTVAQAGPPAKRGCAKASGNCSKRKLDGRHYLKMDLTRSRWNGTSLFMASFRFSDLWRARFRGADLRRADLSRGNRTNTDFRGADLSYANLARSDFYRSNFRKANLTGARLTNARFDHTNLFFANFKGAYFSNTSFYGVRLCHTIQPNGVERNDNCSSGGNGRLPSGGDCCFPGKDPSKDQGKGNNNSGNSNNNGSNNNGNGVVVGEL